MPPSGPDEVQRWWCLHTRPRSEKSLARKCLARRLSFFLPLYQRRWKNQGRSFQSYMPLFPGYVFLHGDSEARLAALETNLVAQVLNVPDPGQLQADLSRVHQLMASGSPLLPEDGLQPGQVVEIAHGPLAGLVGKILSCRKNLRFLVEVQFLQRGVSVEIERWMVQPLQEPPLSARVDLPIPSMA